MSTAIVKYNSTDIAASTLHRDITVAGREDLKVIYKALPQGAEAVVQFFVTTDLPSIAGSSIPKEEPKMYHAATILLKRPVDRKSIDVTATISSYVTGSYQTPAMLEGPFGIARRPTEALVTSGGSSSDEVAQVESSVYRYPIISSDGIYLLRTHSVAKGFPIPCTLAGAMQRIFKDGVPLPLDQRFHYCTLTVAVNIPFQRTQILYIHRGVRGTGEKIGVENPWNGLCYGYADAPEYLQLKNSALEASKPRQVPDSARELTRMTGGGVVSGFLTASEDGGRATLPTPTPRARIEEVKE